MKIDGIKVAGIAATLLGVASTALTGYVNNVNMKKEIAIKVAEEVKKQL